MSRVRLGPGRLGITSIDEQVTTTASNSATSWFCVLWTTVPGHGVVIKGRRDGEGAQGLPYAYCPACSWTRDGSRPFLRRLAHR